MSQFALYIHYPFCTARCPYCGFSTAIDKNDLSDRYRTALLQELTAKLSESHWKNRSVSSIYFGGGTPSLMSPLYIKSILKQINSLVDVQNEIEITLEANPELNDIQLFTEFKSAGINRLSIGAQSFIPEELRILRRTHSPEDIISAVYAARHAGFTNISVDFIYGIPGQTVESFHHTINQGLSLNIDHISAYTLSIEEGTPFARNVRNKIFPVPDPDLAADQYDLLTGMMSTAGFDHYELTNYACDGKWSRHNHAYWSRIPYLGIGSGAHSFDGSRHRFWNIKDTRDYITAVDKTVDPCSGEEYLDSGQIVEERIYLGLRTKLGLNRQEFEGLIHSNRCDELISQKYLIEKDGILNVSEDKWLMLDAIVLKLLEKDT